MAAVSGGAGTEAGTEKSNGRAAAGVTARGLAKRYERPGEPAVQVLQDCSFEILPGKLTVLMGASGVGKSTIAHLLAGYVRPDAGALHIDGAPIEHPGPDRLMVFQETALWPWMTVLDNVLFGPRASRALGATEAKERASALLAKFGVLDFKDKYPGQLSGGMRRRVELAQALINNPRLMILDEPFRGLDVMTRALMQEYYLKLFEETRLTTLFITSDVEEAIFLGDRVLVMAGAPARIVRSMDINLPSPRKPEMLAADPYPEIQRELMAALYSTEL